MACNAMRAFGLLALTALGAGLLGLVVGWLAFGSNEAAPYVDWWRPDGLKSPRRFFTAGAMHTAGYIGGALGALFAMIYQVRAARRSNLPGREPPESRA